MKEQGKSQEGSERGKQPPKIEGPAHLHLEGGVTDAIGHEALGGEIDSQTAMLQRLNPAQQRAMAQRVGQTQGNHHVQRLAASLRGQKSTLQPKLTVNAPNDSYEQEADHVADAVMRAPTPDQPDEMETSVARKPAISSIQAKSDQGGEVSEGVQQSIDTMAGGGQPLADEERTFFESRMGADLSSVRVHTDSTAVQTSRDLSARAFTVGGDIAFNSGEYQPGTSEGRHLLAHELTHVVQQGAAPAIQTKPETAHVPGCGCEVCVGGSRQSGDTIQRHHDEDEQAVQTKPETAHVPGCGCAVCVGGPSQANSTVQRHHDEEQAVQPKRIQRHHDEEERAIQPKRIQRALAAGTMIQRHESFEHRLLGDATPDNLSRAAGRVSPEERQHVLEQEWQRIQIWQRNPESVTLDQVQAQWPDARVLTLKGSGLVLTYGEMNALPDYMADPESIDAAGRDVILPLLQHIREQTFNNLTDLLGKTRLEMHGKNATTVPDHRAFEGATRSGAGAGVKGSVAAALDVRATDSLTKEQGGGHDAYQALLSRNACHFAPYSWNRWAEFHDIARQFAEEAFVSGDEEKARQAWLNNGYADHFLQDSFAAGHLINKTLVMQWFVEWAEQNDVTLKNWWRIRTMTTDQQPGISAPHLYEGPHEAGQSTDPQRAQEYGSREERMNASGVQASGGYSQEDAYQNYLAFLNSSAVQNAAGDTHNFFNNNSLWVSSPAQPKAYQIFGDDTMLTGGDGVQFAGETARMSQQAIEETITTGDSSVNVQDIRDRFPDRVHMTEGAEAVPLVDWNEELRALCFTTIFPDAYRWIFETFSPEMGMVSRDMEESGPELDDDAVRTDVTASGQADIAKRPVTERIQMLHALSSGATMNEDELTMISVLHASKEAGDLVTVIDGADAHTLAYDVDGDEYDVLRQFLRANYYAATSQDRAFNLIFQCIDGETAEWEEEMVMDILEARSDARDLIIRVGQGEGGGFDAGVNELEWQLDGAEEDRLDSLVATL